MRAADLKSKILSLVAGLSIAIIVLMPFHAFLTVWGSQVVGHYTLLRLWKEALLFVCAAGVSYLLIKDKRLRFDNNGKRLFWLIIAYVVVNLILGIVAYKNHNVSLKALGYSLIINLRFPIFLIVTWAITQRSNILKDNWGRILLWSAVLVVAFAVIQEFLPARFLEHFGYSSSTVLPFQYVDNNSLFLRVQSTLRGANPLGAYLLLIITSLLATTVLRQKKFSVHDFYNKKVLLTLMALVAMFLTYSRSAWLGMILSGGVLFIITQYRKPIFKRLFVSSTLVIIFAASFVVANIEHNKTIENVVLHTSQSSNSPVTSNSSHLTKLKDGAIQVAHEPLGRGPGSAGPASVYNNHPARIAENYYIQIGQELGWIGLLTFLLINFYLGYMLWLRRGDTLALSLFASLLGISLINMLSHAWTDDTLAYIWWGLAGVAIAQSTRVDRSK